MIAEIEDFKTGWYGVYLRFSEEEIEKLIESLRSLQNRSSGHFHFEGLDYDGKGGIADVEISLKGKHEQDNMKVM